MPNPVPSVTPATKPKHHSRGLVVIFVAVVMVAVVFAQRQAIYDWYRLRGYQAPANVVALAEATKMTPKSKHSFYVNRPAVQERTAFNASCPNNGGEQTIILGCYKPLQRGIFIYDVTDPQLKGVQEVTAAHEMLHSAYDRLSPKERTTVDALLQDYYDNNVPNNKQLKATFDSYKKSEPNDLINEMHSIFGTEIVQLPPALENYYKQYFSDRQAVVAFANQYRNAFTSRQNQIAAYDQQLQDLKKQIEENQASLTARSNSLDTQRQELDRLLNGGDTASYNARVNSFNAQINAYNVLVAQTKRQIATYNETVAKRNAIAVEAQNLSQELNSHIQPQTTN